eukprot:6815387-Heterocapsa_arctica.AAC.1
MAECNHIVECKHMQSNNQLNRNAYNAVQVRLKDKHVDINIDKDQKGGDECYNTLGASKNIGANHYNIFD